MRRRKNRIQTMWKTGLNTTADLLKTAKFARIVQSRALPMSVTKCRRKAKQNMITESLRDGKFSRLKIEKI